MKTTILQNGGPCSDLLVYAHIDGSILKPIVPSVTNDAMVTLFAGAGTSAYRGAVAGVGGWRPFVASLEKVVGHPVNRTLLISWSAGSQVALEACGSEDGPDTIVMLDGLYGGKPPGSKMGDGKVSPSPLLEAAVSFALKAARREKTPRGVERMLVIFHSRIATSYASSKECAEYVQARVEAEIGKMQPASDVDAHLLDGHFFLDALALGNLRIVEFAGADAAEHIRQAHLWDEAARLWVPWISGPNVCGAAPSSPQTLPSPVEPAAPLARVLRLQTPMLRGDDVKAWQVYLRGQGAELDADGIFGPVSKAKTAWFQTAFALTATGELDTTTLAAARAAGFQAPAAQPAPAAPVVQADVPSPAAAPVARKIGAAVIARALADLGVREDLGHNDGVRIREMMAPWGGKPGQNWCAFATSTWIKLGAADALVEPPIPGSGGAQAIMAQFKAVKRWISAAEARKNPSLVRAGLVPVWDRSVAGDPSKSWWGHVGVTTGPADASGKFPTIEGNSGIDGARCARMERALSDGRLFGFGVLD